MFGIILRVLCDVSHLQPLALPPPRVLRLRDRARDGLHVLRVPFLGLLGHDLGVDELILGAL